MAPGKWSKPPRSIAALREVIQPRNGRSSQTDASPSGTEDTSSTTANTQNELPHIHVSRGKTKGKGLDRYMKAYGKIPVHIPESKGRPVNRVTSAKFSNELGIIARRSIPIGTESYNKLKDAEKELIYERIKDRFNLLDEGPHVERCINTIVASRFKDYVCRLHKKWNTMIEDGMSHSEARNSPPVDIVKDDWVIRCAMWEDEAYQEKCAKNAKNRAKNQLNHVTGSMPYVVARNEMGNPDRVEFFGKCYGGSEKNDFKTELAKETYERMLAVKESCPEMSHDEIAETVLGKRSGRIAGLVFGPRPEMFSHLKGSYSKMREQELKAVVSAQQEKLEAQDEKLEAQQGQIQDQGDKIRRLEEMLVKFMEQQNASS